MLTYAAYLARHKTSRGGVIPYTMKDGKIYFLLARHGESRDLGDFGGGIKKHEFSLNGSIREYIEETHGMFSVSTNDLLDKLALVDGVNMSIVFVPVDQSWYQKAPSEFQKSKLCSAKKGSNEISEVVWIDENAFIRLVYGNEKYGRFGQREKLWTRIKKFFQKTDVRQMTHELKMAAKYTVSSG